MMVVAFAGKAGSGKDYTATAVQKRLEEDGLVVARARFSDTLKDLVAAVLGISRKELDAVKDGRDGPEKADKMRRLLQTVGTEGFRAYDEDVWVRRMEYQMMNLKTLNPMPDVVLITDLRLPNEFDFIRSLGGTTVLVEAPAGLLRTSGKTAQHASEVGLDSYRDRFDVVLYEDRRGPDAIRDYVDLVVVAMQK